MNKALTLDQVREAGRFAEQPEEDLEFWPITRGLVVYSWTKNDMPDDNLPQTGWHHEDGCNCEFCRS